VGGGQKLRKTAPRTESGARGVDQGEGKKRGGREMAKLLYNLYLSGVSRERGAAEKGAAIRKRRKIKWRRDRSGSRWGGGL